MTSLKANWVCVVCRGIFITVETFILINRLDELAQATADHNYNRSSVFLYYISI